MQVATHPAADTTRHPAAAYAAAPKQRSRPAAAAPATEQQQRDIEAMRVAYGPSGGWACADVVTTLLRRHVDQPLSQLARWIVAGELVSFDWQSQTLIPLFQFDPETMAVRPGVRAVVAELSSAFDGWELAAWFAQPNGWLGGATPVELLQTDLPAVLQAARADRFVVTGWA